MFWITDVVSVYGCGGLLTLLNIQLPLIVYILNFLAVVTFQHIILKNGLISKNDLRVQIVSSFNFWFFIEIFNCGPILDKNRNFLGSIYSFIVDCEMIQILNGNESS